MPAAYPFYVFATFLFGAAALTWLSAKRRWGAPRCVWAILASAGVLAAIWGLCGGFYAVYALSDRVSDVRSLKPEEIVAVDILPSWHPEAYPSLVNKEVHVTDRQKINDIVAGVVGSRPWYPNHPATQWVCILHIDDGNAVHACTVSCTTNNGVLIEIWSQGDQGWLLGVYREDGLQDVLGAFADSKRGRS